MPLLSRVLEGNLRQLMKMFAREAVVDEATTPYKLLNLDLEEKETFLPYNSVISCLQQLKHFWHHLKQVQRKNLSSKSFA